MGSVLDVRTRVGEKAHQGIFWGRQERMSGQLATVEPRRIKAAHRRRRKCAVGRFVQRYYDPAIGRFLSVDPVTADGNTGGNFNRYWYANNNPYRFTDPDGRAPCEVCEALRNDPMLFPKGDIVRTTGDAVAGLTAYAVGIATGDQGLQDAAIDGMRESVTPADGLNAAMMAVGPRGGAGAAEEGALLGRGKAEVSGRSTNTGLPAARSDANAVAKSIFRNETKGQQVGRSQPTSDGGTMRRSGGGAVIRTYPKEVGKARVELPGRGPNPPNKEVIHIQEKIK